MGCEDEIRLMFTNGSHYLFDWRRRKRRLRAGHFLCGSENRGLRGNGTHVEDLAPAETEPAVADDQTMLACCELARHGFHAIGAAARNHDGRLRVIDLLQNTA